MPHNDPDNTDAQNRRRMVGYRPAFRAVIVRAPSVFSTVILNTPVSQLAFSLSSGPVSLGLLEAIDRTDIDIRWDETGQPSADTGSDASVEVG